MRALYYKLRRRWLLLTMRLNGTWSFFNYGYRVAPLLVAEEGGDAQAFAIIVGAVALADKFTPLAPPEVQQIQNGTKSWLVEHQGRFVPGYMGGES